MASITKGTVVNNTDEPIELQPGDELDVVTVQLAERIQIRRIYEANQRQTE